MSPTRVAKGIVTMLAAVFKRVELHFNLYGGDARLKEK